MAGKKKPKSIPNIIVESVYEVEKPNPKKIATEYAWCVRGIKKQLDAWTYRDLTGNICVYRGNEDALLNAIYVFLDLCRQGYLSVNKEFFTKPLTDLVSGVFGDNFEQYSDNGFKLSKEILKEKSHFSYISSDGLKALEKIIDEILLLPETPNDVIKEPLDLITLIVATDKFKVSKPTLYRAIKDGRLKKHKNSINKQILLSEREIGKYWPAN